MKKLVIGIDKEEIEKKQRYDLIPRSLTLGLIELGYSNISMTRLKDKDGQIQIQIKDES